MCRYKKILSLKNNTGILVGMPDAFYRRVVREEIGQELGPINSYGTGIVFTPKGDVGVAALMQLFEDQCKLGGMKVIGWRNIQTGIDSTL